MVDLWDWALSVPPALGGVVLAEDAWDLADFTNTTGQLHLFRNGLEKVKYSTADFIIVRHQRSLGDSTEIQ